MRGDTKRSTLKAWLLLVCLLQISAAQSAPKISEVRVHLQRAQAALKANAPEVAVKEFRVILALDPKNAEAHTNLGVIEFSKGDYWNAEQEFRSALAVAPTLIQAQALLGICEKRLGKPSAGPLLRNHFRT
jgi:Tfp pilus assembly protein PilF